MAEKSSIGKVAYIYNQADDTWYPVAGVADATANYSWTGSHTFAPSSSVVVNKSLVAKNGINNFTNVAERNTHIPSPTDGTIALVIVNGAMQVQIYLNGAWRLYGSNAFLEEKTSFPSNIYNIELLDAGKTVEINSSSTVTVRVPLDTTLNFPVGSQMAFIQTNTGQVVFEGESAGITTTSILSKNSNKKMSARYSQAVLVKKAANTWYLMGDLTA